MIVLLDLNILLDVVLAREPWATEAVTLCDRAARGDFEAVVAAASVPTLFYVVRKAKGADAALAAVDLCLQSFRLAELNEAVLMHARTISAADFEDNIQIACAEQAKARFIVTRDLTGFKASSIPPLSPPELLGRL